MNKLTGKTVRTFYVCKKKNEKEEERKYHKQIEQLINSVKYFDYFIFSIKTFFKK